VEIMRGVELDANQVLEYGAEKVVFATGARWSRSGINFLTHTPIPGADATLPHVHTPEQVMDGGKEVVGNEVVIYDCDGYFTGPSLAEKLAFEGRDVTLVTPKRQVAEYMFTTGEGPRMIGDLLGLGVKLIADYALDVIGPSFVRGHNVYCEDAIAEWTTKAVILVTQRLSEDALYQSVYGSTGRLTENAISGVFRIGDCLEPRVIADCIFDGHRLAREFDSANPSVPLPFIREHRIMGATDETYETAISA
jgi:dimethylamine/trimethylamine dehydrogenase